MTLLVGDLFYDAAGDHLAGTTPASACVMTRAPSTTDVCGATVDVLEVMT